MMRLVVLDTKNYMTWANHIENQIGCYSCVSLNVTWMEMIITYLVASGDNPPRDHITATRPHPPRASATRVGREAATPAPRPSPRPPTPPLRAPRGGPNPHVAARVVSPPAGVRASGWRRPAAAPPAPATPPGRAAGGPSRRPPPRAAAPPPAAAAGGPLWDGRVGAPPTVQLPLGPSAVEGRGPPTMAAGIGGPLPPSAMPAAVDAAPVIVAIFGYATAAPRGPSRRAAAGGWRSGRCRAWSAGRGRHTPPARPPRGRPRCIDG